MSKNNEHDIFRDVNHRGGDVNGKLETDQESDPLPEDSEEILFNSFEKKKHDHIYILEK